MKGDGKRKRFKITNKICQSIKYLENLRKFILDISLIEDYSKLSSRVWWLLISCSEYEPERDEENTEEQKNDKSEKKQESKN
ncbi:hypothetical protein [endosymbiont GvMRE of Glomus versiforme]|uniref:hypothetical protein n=1 Tax=endosymbiont GvMRE of Glomus versiforme TaxID=2039283 RepID=UPI00155880F2|nr:hypothetical protein [endosymbiont GvMRE of Glomus versiforme]